MNTVLGLLMLMNADPSMQAPAADWSDQDPSTEQVEDFTVVQTVTE